ncbi:MAG: hypothetical protein ACUVWR_16125 [Anaerolineae bacterium]
MWKGKKQLLWLLAVLLVVTSCKLNWGRDSASTSRSGASGDWLTVSSEDGQLAISVPGDWRVSERAGSAINLKAVGGCTLDIELAPESKKAGLSQTDVLGLMLDKAVAEQTGKGQEIETVGRRVWMGQHYIWHELHYIVSGGGRASYYIDFVAYPNNNEALKARYICPGKNPPEEEEAALLQGVIDTVQAHAPREA